MNVLLVLGTFILGAAVGALLTAISYSGRISYLEADNRILSQELEKSPRKGNAEQGAA